MAIKSERVFTPPIVSYTSFVSFLNQLRETGTMPARIDKTLMPKASGSQSSGMLAALKYLSLIDDAGSPAQLFKDLVAAEDDARKSLMAGVLRQSYRFLFDDLEFDLEQASAGQMAEKFRQLEIRGSTVTKTIAFFLAAAKESGLSVSPYIKPPSVPKGTTLKKAVKTKEEDKRSERREDSDDSSDTSDVERFEIPIPGKSSVKVIVPADLDAADWEMLQQMITVYINRWKGFKVPSAQVAASSNLA